MDTSTADPVSLLSLPDELLRAVLDHVGPVGLASVQKTCRRLNEIAADPLLWESACFSFFTWWDKGHDFEAKRKDATFSAWKRLFAERWSSSQKTKRALTNLVGAETHRLDQIAAIMNAGYDAKDVLIKAFNDSPHSESHLAQRYWSHATLGHLHRYMACEEWAYLKYRPDTPNATERSLAALDMFVLGERTEGDIDDIFARLDSYVAAIRQAHPEIDSYTPRHKATTIATYLLERKWVGIGDGRNYHSLDHMFLGIALFSQNRNSVPLISAIIYCYVVRQFNLQAQPISYPFHVHALITLDPTSTTDLDGQPLPPSPEPHSPATHLFMDPFNTATPIPASHLTTQLRFIAPTSSPTQITSYLSPATPTDLTIRAAHNILAAPSHYSGPPIHPIPLNSAAFGALLSLVLLPQHPNPAQVSHHLSVVAQHFAIHFDHDVQLFSHHVLPAAAILNNAQAYASLAERLRMRDAMPKTPKRRHRVLQQPIGAEDGGGAEEQEIEETENAHVKFRVGQVFRHRMRGYLAVIYGWDAWCKMDEQWIVQNSVDRLPRGRGQPFYNVL